VLGNDGLELLQLIGAKAAQVVVQGIDARHGPAGQVLEQRVGGQPFKIENAPRADYRRIDEQLDLRVDW
jgi:predicted short-subunit dehydrogenase-like oxidoreductase (DUF2520 family)